MNQLDLIHSPAGKQWQEIGIQHHHGIAIPLFSLYSSKSYGIGEYPDLMPLIDWCNSMSFDVIQLLPLNDCGDDISPYSALSAFALNPIYLGLESLPFLKEDQFLQKELIALPKITHQQKLNYHAVREIKDHFFRLYFSVCAPKILQSDSYLLFLEEAKWLKGYAVFKILKERNRGAKWETWPEEERFPTDELIDQIANKEKDKFNWHCLLQYLCDLQLKEVKAYAKKKNLHLMGDIPILIDRQSADVWQYQELFDLKFSAGAPPDQYSENGQNWGFPLYNWQAIENQEYRWWIDRLQWNKRYFHIYRIDHIVGFFRIWAIPVQQTGKEGHFIPQDESIWIEHGQKILLMMLKACDMLPIGEDLGNVPDEVRACMNTLGISGTRVMRWERKWKEEGQYILPENYPFDSMTTVSTHDSETLAHWWKNYPIEAQLFATQKGWSYQYVLSHDHHREILWDSHHTASLFHINLLQEYLSLIPGLSWPTPEDERINTPGIISDDNWTYRYRVPLEEIIENKSLKHLMQELIS